MATLFLPCGLPDKKGELERSAIHAFEGDQIYSEKPKRNLMLNASFAEVNADDYDARLIGGGRVPEHIRLNEIVLAIVKHFAAARKPIAAICHRAQMMIADGVLKDMSCTCSPSVAPDIISSGGRNVDIPLGRAHVGDHLMTAPAWLDHPD